MQMVVALENVYEAITSNGRRDFATLAAAFSSLGYRFGAVVVDTVHFLPQPRPRFFIIGIRGDLSIPTRGHTADGLRGMMPLIEGATYSRRQQRLIGAGGIFRHRLHGT